MADYLVDASVWAAYFRGRSAAVKGKVDELLDDNRAAACGVVLTELLSAINDEGERRFLEECFRGLPYLEATREVFAAAGQMGADLRQRDEAAPLTDLLLLALAREHRLTLYTFNDRLADLARAQGVAVAAPSAAGPAAPVRSRRGANQRGG